MTPQVPGPEEGLNASVAAELRAEQARRKWSVQQLSEKSGIPYGSLRRYMNADRPIDVEVLAALCGAFGITMTTLVERATAANASGRPDTPELAAVALEGDEDAGEPEDS